MTTPPPFAPPYLLGAQGAPVPALSRDEAGTLRRAAHALLKVAQNPTPSNVTAARPLAQGAARILKRADRALSKPEATP